MVHHKPQARIVPSVNDAVVHAVHSDNSSGQSQLGRGDYDVPVLNF